MHPYLNTAINAARKASNIIMHGFERRDKIRISKKGPKDYVTNIDKDAENAIIDVLRTAYPSHAFITEESGRFGRSDYEWVIDPLDGTTNFIHGFPHFAISIALMHKQRVEHALIFDPIRNDLFTATRGEGAQQNGYRIRTSQRFNMKECLLATGAPHDRPDLLEQHLKTIPIATKESLALRSTGSTVLNLAYVAAGILDGYWKVGSKIWDLAAGTLIIREAGGLMSDIYGKDEYLKNGHIITANPKLFNKLLSIIKPFFKEQKEK